MSTFTSRARCRVAVAMIMLLGAACESTSRVRAGADASSDATTIASPATLDAAAVAPQAASSHGSANDLDASPDGAAAAIAQARASTAAYARALAKGRAATAKKQYADAIAAFGDAVTARPQDGRAHAERGYAELLAGDLEESAKDLDQAVALGGTSELQGQAWFNLGLVREKQANAADARVAFAISNRLRPTVAVKKKLGGASACPVLRKTTGQDMSFAKTLHDLASTETDDEAKQALCVRTEGVMNVPEPAACSGPAPWTITHDYMLHRAFVRLIYPVRGGFLLHEAGNVGGWPSICSGDREVNGMLEGDTPHVRTEYTPGVVVEADDPNAEEGQIGTGNHCAEGVKEIEDTFYDARGKHLLTIVRYEFADAHADAGANVELHVAGSDVVLAGGGCNESIPLSPDAGRVR